MNAQVFLLYLATWSLVAITPGPAVMCSMSYATRYGMRHAWAGVAGIQCGHLVFFTCAAFGIATVLETMATAFTALRIAGAVYLVYLGIRAIASASRAREPLQTSEPIPPSRRSLLLQGFAIQVTNPKALLFMSALLPQFIQPQQPLAGQWSLLLAATIAVDAIVLGSYAAFAARGARSLRKSQFLVWMERIFGAVLVGFGVRLLASRK